MFYHFSQNNSGGSFEGDFRHIIIEAPTAKVANILAQSTEIYFDGCYDGKDCGCECCGDRWSRTYDGDGDDRPMVYSIPAEDFEDDFFGGGIKIIYLDGTVKEYKKEWK